MKRILLAEILIVLNALNIQARQKESAQERERQKEAGWDYVVSSGLFDLYYNPEKTLKDADGTFRVWTKVIPVEGADKTHVLEFIQVTSEVEKSQSRIYVNFAYRINQEGLDCKRRLSRLYEITDYDGQGAVIFSKVYEDQPWQVSPPHSIYDHLFSKVCR